MKKLLLIINTLVFSSFIGACQSNPKTVTTNETKPETVVTPTKKDTVKTVNGQTNTTGPGGSTSTVSTTNKDAVKKPVKAKAITHTAPEQARIDSLKKAKTKSKNQKK